MKRQELEAMAAEAYAIIEKSEDGSLPKPGTPPRLMADLLIRLAIDTLSLLDRAVVALEKIAAEREAGR